MEQIKNSPASEAVSGALLLLKLSQFLDKSIESDISLKNNDVILEPLVKVIAAAKERGIQRNRYVSTAPMVVEVGETYTTLWEYVMIIYLQSLIKNSQNVDFNDSTQVVIIDDLSLISLIEETYDYINDDIGSAIDMPASKIATSMNDHIKPLTSTDKAYQDGGLDVYSVSVQENVWMIEAFLCDMLGLPLKTAIEAPIGFSRPPDSADFFLDNN